MGIQVAFTVVCDGCNLTMIHTMELNERTAQNIMSAPDDPVTKTATDVWSWAIPDDWIVSLYLNETPRLFHSTACAVAWCRANGRDEDADSLESGVWVA